MATKELKIKMVLVQQGDVTVAAGEVPIVEEIGMSVCEPLRQAVNFLRCKCPAVQIPLGGGVREDQLRPWVEGELAKYALPGETFSIEGKFESDGVILIRRVVAPA